MRSICPICRSEKDYEPELMFCEDCRQNATVFEKALAIAF